MKKTIYDNPVEIAAPSPAKIGTNKILPTILVKQAPNAVIICHWLFFINTIPLTVVSEIVYMIGLNIKKGIIVDAFLYFSPNNRTIKLLLVSKQIPIPNITKEIASFTLI